MTHASRTVLRLAAVLLLELPPVAGHAQQPPRDCAVPSHPPKGPTPKSLSDCAMTHALYLYANRCIEGPDCAAANEPVIGAFKTASRIFETYLASRGQAASPAQEANDNYKRGLLQEGAHEYGEAVFSYHRCQQLANASSSGDLTRCSENYLRLKCSADPRFAFCQSTGSGITQTVTMTTTTESGGFVASAVGDDQPAITGQAAPDRSKIKAKRRARHQSESLTVAVNLPSKREISEITRSMTEAEKLALEQAFKQQKLVVIPESQPGHEPPANAR